MFGRVRYYPYLCTLKNLLQRAAIEIENGTYGHEGTTESEIEEYYNASKAGIRANKLESILN